METLLVDIIIILPFIYLFLTKSIKQNKPLYYTPWAKHAERGI